MPRIYDKKYLYRCLASLVAMAVMMHYTGGAAFALILPITLFASMKKKPETLFFLLSMSISMMMGNPNLIPKGSIFGYSQRAAMMLISLVMLTQIFGRRNSPLLSPLLGIFPYLLWMALVSAAGWCPFISYLKLILFTAVFFAYYGSANLVATSWHTDAAKIRSVFLALAVFFLLGSLALIPFPGISQMHGERLAAAIKAGEDITSLFMGMTMHSQTLGPICAILGVALFGDLVFNVHRMDRLYVLLLLCTPVVIWKTSCRTAMGAFVIGMMICAYFAFSTRLLAPRWRKKVEGGFWMIIVAGALATAIVPSVRDKVAGFVMKYDRGAKMSQINSEGLLSTRQFRWDIGMANFRRSPVFGNGFQVSEDMKRLKPSLSILSAPVEKSIWISAILEEGGAVGLILFVIYLITAYMQLKSRKAYIGLSLFLVFVIINFGEFTVFSMSGTGGFCWLIVFVGLMLDAVRQREIRGMVW